MIIVSYQKMAWISDEKNDFTEIPIYFRKRALFTHYLRCSFEMFWYFIEFNSCKYLKSNYIVSVWIFVLKSYNETNGFTAMPILLRKRALLTHYFRLSCEIVKSHCFCCNLFQNAVIAMKIVKKSKLFWVCCHGNQFYATRRTCLQLHFERCFKYLQCYSL